MSSSAARFLPWFGGLLPAELLEALPEDPSHRDSDPLAEALDHLDHPELLRLAGDIHAELLEAGRRTASMQTQLRGLHEAVAAFEPRTKPLEAEPWYNVASNFLARTEVPADIAAYLRQVPPDSGDGSGGMCDDDSDGEIDVGGDGYHRAFAAMAAASVGSTAPGSAVNVGLRGKSAATAAPLVPLFRPVQGSLPLKQSASPDDFWDRVQDFFDPPSEEEMLLLRSMDKAQDPAFRMPQPGQLESVAGWNSARLLRPNHPVFAANPAKRAPKRRKRASTGAASASSNRSGGGGPSSTVAPSAHGQPQPALSSSSSSGSGAGLSQVGNRPATTPAAVASDWSRGTQPQQPGQLPAHAPDSATDSLLAKRRQAEAAALMMMPVAAAGAKPEPQVAGLLDDAKPKKRTKRLDLTGVNRIRSKRMQTIDSVLRPDKAFMQHSMTQKLCSLLIPTLEDQAAATGQLAGSPQALASPSAALPMIPAAAAALPGERPRKPVGTLEDRVRAEFSYLGLLPADIPLKGQLQEPEEPRSAAPPDDQGAAALRRLQVLLGEHLSRSAPLRASVLQPAARVAASREAVTKVQSAQANLDRVYRRYVRRTSTQALRQALRQLRRVEAKYLNGGATDEEESTVPAGDDEDGAAAAVAASAAGPRAGGEPPAASASASSRVQSAPGAGPALVDLEHVRQDPANMPGWPRAELVARLGLPPDEASRLVPPTPPPIFP